MFYLPRKLNNFDQFYTASDDSSSYESAYPVEFYIKSVDGFSGDGNFMSKFGLEIRDQVILSIAQRVFNEEVGSYTTLTRPREGDIVFFPLNKKPFIIRYVNKFEMFYQLGALQTWEVTCEVFEYSNETFNTGIAEIDAIQVKYSTDILDYSVRNEAGDFILTEDGDYITSEKYDLEAIITSAENDIIQTESDTFVDFTVKDPFSEGLI